MRVILIAPKCGANELWTGSGTLEFFRFALPSPGDISTLDFEYIESYVVLAEQQSCIPYMCGKSLIDSIKYFRPVRLRIFRPFPPFSSSFPRTGTPRARQIYTAFKKVKEKNSKRKELPETVYGLNTSKAHFIETIRCRKYCPFSPAKR